MTIQRSRGANALFAALLVASCSQSPTSPTAAGPAAASIKVSDGGGIVSGSAAGDVKNGPIEMTLVRVGQGAGGAAAFYANAGGAYNVRANVDTEIYVQIWTSNPVVQNPRLIVDWGNGERDNTGCGGCRLSKTYREGRYTVTVIMDDRAGGQTSRTFTLNVGNEALDPGFGVFSGSLASTDGTFDITPCGFGSGSGFFYDTYPIHHPGGHLRIETTTDVCDDTMVGLYSTSNLAPCGFVAFNDDNGNPSCGVWSTIDGTYPQGDYVVLVTSYGGGSTFNYRVTIGQ